MNATTLAKPPSAFALNSAAWVETFSARAAEREPLRWPAESGLSAAERALIGPSLREFQQGEAQEGAHFYRVAGAHAERHGDRAYVRAHQLFMAEEQRHGADLARFLELAGVPVLARRSWLAWGFCWAGSRGGLGVALIAVLESELIALVYYRALREATDSPLLRELCAEILRDEVVHVRFHAQRLRLMRADHGPLRRALLAGRDRLLFAALIPVVWWRHGRVLRAGGLGPLAFWRDAWRRYEQVIVRGGSDV